MELKRVVITGLGAVTPLGNDVMTTWNAMLNGQSGSGAITLFDCSHFKTLFACEVKNFDVSSIIDKKDERKIERYAQMALVTAAEAWKDANIEGKVDPVRAGVIWGSGMGGLYEFTKGLKEFFSGNGTPYFNPFFVPKIIPDMAPGLISIHFGLKGINYSTAAACASSALAISNSFNEIRLGKADVMVTGGSEAPITEASIGGFNALRALSTRNNEPTKASRPFSASRDGFVMGEGGACLILEELEHAKARGAKIYAELIGTGATADAFHMTAPDPNGAGASRVMQAAITEAGIRPEQIDYINTHGTSTPLGDITEIKAIQNVFGDHAYKLNLDSTKSMTGHLLGGAGAVEALATILALRDQIVPPTINHEEGDEDEKLDYRLNFTFNHAQERNIEFALSNAFGFGGHNACLLFKRWK